MHAFLVYVVSLVAVASAQHWQPAHLSDPWVTADADSALARAMITASAASPVASAYGPVVSAVNPFIHATTGASEEAALTRAVIAASAASPSAATFPSASAISPLARALAAAGSPLTPAYPITPMAKVCSEGTCKFIPAATLYNPSASSLDLGKKIKLVSPSGTELSAFDDASIATTFIDPTSAAEAIAAAKLAAAGRVMVPIDAASPAAAFIDPTSDIYAKYVNDASAVELTRPFRTWAPIVNAWPQPLSATGRLVTAKYGSDTKDAAIVRDLTAAKYAEEAAKYAIAAKYAADAEDAAIIRGLDASKYAADVKYAHDAILGSPLSAGRLVKVCSEGICRIVDSASASTDLAAASRGLAIAKYADKYADDVKYAHDAILGSPLSAGRLVKVCSEGICRIVDSASASTDLAAASRGLAIAKYADKYADDVKYAHDGIISSPLSAGRLVKVCSEGVCRIVDAASATAKLAAASRGLAIAKNAAKYADDAAKYAETIGAKFILAN